MQVPLVRMIASAMVFCGVVAGLSAQQIQDQPADNIQSSSSATINTLVSPPTKDVPVASAASMDTSPTIPSPPPTAPNTTNPPGPPTTSSVTATLPVTAKRPTLMVRRGNAELEWRLGYSHSSRNAIYVDGIAMLPVLVVGTIGVERLRRDNITSAFSFRYGLDNNLLGEVKVPVRYENDRYSVPEVSPAQEESKSSFGIGDIEGAISYQFRRKSEEDIRWILTTSVKSNTGGDPYNIDLDDICLGSGFWNARIGLTGVIVSDPAAVYWNVGYGYNFQRDDIQVTLTNSETGEQTIASYDIKPGDSFEFGGGFAYAVNQRLSVNTGLSVCFNGATLSNDKRVANTTLTSASLRLGAVWLTDHGFPVDLGLNIGLTDDSPDFNIEYRQSYKL